MDPTIALDLLREAQRDGRRDDADDHAEDLGSWLLAGGFAPEGITRDETWHALEIARSRAVRRAVQIRMALEITR